MYKHIKNILTTVLIVLIVILDTAYPGYHLRGLIFVPMYVTIVSMRNNYYWYFIFEAFIIMTFTGIWLIDNTLYSLVFFVITILLMSIYLIVAVFMNSRGYPFLKNKK